MLKLACQIVITSIAPPFWEERDALWFNQWAALAVVWDVSKILPAPAISVYLVQAYVFALKVNHMAAQKLRSHLLHMVARINALLSHQMHR